MLQSWAETISLQRSWGPILSIPLTKQSSMKTHSKLHTIGVMALITHSHAYCIQVSKEFLSKNCEIDWWMENPSPDSGVHFSYASCLHIRKDRHEGIPTGVSYTSTSITLGALPWRPRTVPGIPCSHSTIKSQSICGVFLLLVDQEPKGDSLIIIMLPTGVWDWT